MLSATELTRIVATFVKLRYKPHGEGAASTQINIHLIAQSLLVPYSNKSKCTQDDRGQAAGTSYKSLCCCEPNLRRPQIHIVGPVLEPDVLGSN